MERGAAHGPGHSVRSPGMQARTRQVELPLIPLTDDESDDLESAFFRTIFGPGGPGTGRDHAAEYARDGLPLTVRRGNQIVQISPDGRTDVLVELPMISYELPPGVRILPGPQLGPPKPTDTTRQE